MRCLFLVIFVVVLAGCGRPSPPATAAPKTTREYLARYAELRFTRCTENVLLRDELFRIEAESGLPKQFLMERTHEGNHRAEHALKSITSAAQLNHLDRRLAYVFPQGEFVVAERHIAEIDRLAKDYADLRKELDRFSSAKDWSLDLRFEEGSLFAAHFVPCIEAAIKLELTLSGLAMRRGEWQKATEGFQRTWRSIEVLAAQPHVESRVLAAKLRTSALKLLESMLGSPSCEVKEVRAFRDLLTQSLIHWPADDRVWRGERARALHFFEMIRDGQVLSLASEELQAAIDDHGGPKDFGIWLHSHVDADEVYYLENMRRLIQSCDLPFAERDATLSDLQSDLQRLARSDSDPILTRMMLLTDIEEGMRWQASDRVHCEVMLIALDHAVGESAASAAFTRSPLTGREYRVSVLQRIIRVDGDSEVGEYGLAISAPRYDLEVAGAAAELEQIEPKVKAPARTAPRVSRKPVRKFP